MLSCKLQLRLTSHTQNLKFMDIKLLEMLVCPITKGPLTFDKQNNELISNSAKLAYPIRDGIPVMLEDQAREIEQD